VTAFEVFRVAAGLLLLADALVVLAGLPRWTRRFPGIRWEGLALLEALAALAILAIHFAVG
jgi:hypothetical protein